MGVRTRCPLSGENRLSMLDAPFAEAAERSPAARADSAPCRRRRRALAGCAVLALVLHGAFLGEVGFSTGAPPDATAAAMSVRTVAAEPAQEPAAEASAETVAVTPHAPAPKPRTPRRPREPARPSGDASSSSEQADARSDE